MQQQQRRQFRDDQGRVFRGIVQGAVTVTAAYAAAVLLYLYTEKKKKKKKKRRRGLQDKGEGEDADPSSSNKNDDVNDEVGSEGEEEDGPSTSPSSSSSTERLALHSLLGPACCLLLQIFAVARNRLVTPEDIGGSALGVGTARHVALQGKLQNTLEQTCLAVPVYLASSVTLPRHLKYVTPAASALFVIGRGFFASDLRHGVTPHRAYGFATTFLSTASLLGMNLYFLIRSTVNDDDDDENNNSNSNSNNNKKEQK